MAVQIYYQLIRDIVIDEQLLSMLQPQRRKQLFSFVWNLIKSAAQQPGFFFGNIFIISTQSTSPSLTMQLENLV